VSGLGDHQVETKDSRVRGEAWLPRLSHARSPRAAGTLPGLGSVRFHYLRDTFATLAPSAGEHYMQVSKWLGHSSYLLTLTTYADYLGEDDTVHRILLCPLPSRRTLYRFK
jgi:integrase